MATLDLQGIQCAYGKNVILDDVNISLNNGVTALLGLNGAGKTTLIKTIMRLIKPKNGEIVFNGEDIYKMKSRYYDYVGYMPQMPALYDNFKAYDFCIYMASLKGISKKEAKEKTDILLEKVMLKDVADRKIRTFSGGMKQRVLLAQALLGNPKILILDEPTAGLDPKERISIRNYIAELSKDKIILFATHVVSDIECIADKVLLLKSGEIIATGTPVELIESMAGKVGEITCTLDEVGELQKEYKIGNIRQRKNGLALRVVGDELPEEAVKVGDNIDLEDVYLYYFE